MTGEKVGYHFSITLESAIEVLNRALESDKSAISKLFLGKGVKCNEELAEDETIQIGRFVEDGKTYNRIRPLGLINGMFGISPETGFGPLAMVCQIGCSSCGWKASEVEHDEFENCPKCEAKLGAVEIIRFEPTKDEFMYGERL